MADNKVLIEVAVTGNAEVQFKKLSDSVAQFSNETKKGLADAGRIFDNFAANIASNVVSAGVELIAKSFGNLVDVLGDAIQQAAEQQEAVNRLNSALQQSGQYSAQASKELQTFAAGLQTTTKYADDAVISATALISSLGRLDSEGLQKATVAATNLASALQIDLQTAANLVGKAADGNVSVLSRYGITVKETGDKARDFSIALDEIQRKFGNAATSEVNTYAGSLAQLNNAYNDVLKVVGESIITNPILIEIIKTLGAQFVSLSTYIQKNRDVIDTLTSDALVNLIHGFGSLATALDYAYRGVQILQGAFAALVGTMMRFNPVLAILAQFSDDANNLRQAFIGLSEEGIKRIEESFTQSTFFGQGAEKIHALASGLEVLREKSNELAAQNLQNLAASQVAFEEDAITKEAMAEQRLIAQETEQSKALTSYANYLFQRNEALKKADDEESKKTIAANNAKITAILNSNRLSDRAKLDLQAKTAEVSRQIDEQRAREQMDTLTRIATLGNAKTKELAVVGKASAIALATIDTYKGANKALGSVPFPFNFAAAAAVIAAGLVNVSNIVGTPLATGITEVPAGFQNDTFPARLTSGERVVSAPQNRDLTEFLAGSTGLTSKLDQLIVVLSENNRTVVNIGGREVINAIQSELDSGRNLIV